MMIFGKVVIARDGWPFEHERNRPIKNTMRFLLCASIPKTFSDSNTWYRKSDSGLARRS